MRVGNEPHHLRSLMVVKVLRDGPLNWVRPVVMLLILLHLFGHGGLLRVLKGGGTTGVTAILSLQAFGLRLRLVVSLVAFLERGGTLRLCSG